MIVKLICTVSAAIVIFPVQPYTATQGLLNILRSQVMDDTGKAKLIITIVIVCKF